MDEEHQLEQPASQSLLLGITDASPYRTIDWLGRPTNGRRLGGWIPSICILGAESLHTVAYTGIFLNLVLYLTRVLHKSNASSANDVTNWIGTMYITSLIGASIGDAHLGRLWTCVVYQALLMLGLIFVSLSSAFLQQSDCTHAAISSPCSGQKSQLVFFYLSLYMVALGNGSFLPISISLGADQFDSPRKKSTFINLYLASTNCGMVLSSTAISYVMNKGKWVLGFCISTGAGVVAFVVFLVGMPNSRQYNSGGNPLSRIAQVLVSSIRKWHVVVSSKANNLYEAPDNVTAVQGSRKILHSGSLRWLDKAATITESDKCGKNWSNPWRLCTVTQVEEVKCVCRLMPIWLCAVLFNAVLAQMATLFTEQGQTMKTQLGSFLFPPASMNLFNVLAVTLGATFYSWVVAPGIRGLRENQKDVTQFQRMGVGLVLSMTAMSVAALVERKRLSIANAAAVSAPMSIFWLVPQYVLHGFAQVLFVGGHTDFKYSQAPDAMRSLCTSLALCSYAVGNYVSTLLVTVVSHVTTRGGRMGWIASNLNEGHLDYFYWLLVGILGVDLLLFLFLAHIFTYIRVEIED